MQADRFFLDLVCHYNRVCPSYIKRQTSGNVLEYSEDEPFNPDYVEVDRVLDSSEHTDQDTKVNKPVN